MPADFKKSPLLSIRNRILLFAVLVTLLPSIGLGWVYFTQTEKALLDSSQRELLGTVNHVRREFDLWFKERYYEIRVFSNSYLVSEGLADYLALRDKATEQQPLDDGAQLAKLGSYLSLVRTQFSYYERLSVFDRHGKLLTQNPRHAGALELPGNWQEQLETSKVIVGEVFHSQGASPSVLAAVPIYSGDGSLLGLLAAQVRLDALGPIMTSFIASKDSRAGSAELFLIGRDGRVLLSSTGQGTTGVSDRVHEVSLRPHQLGEYISTRGVPVVGILTPIPEFSLSLVMEKQQDHVFAEMIELRNKALFGVALLVSLIG